MHYPKITKKLETESNFLDARAAPEWKWTFQSWKMDWDNNKKLEREFFQWRWRIWCLSKNLKMNHRYLWKEKPQNHSVNCTKSLLFTNKKYVCKLKVCFISFLAHFYFLKKSTRSEIKIILIPFLLSITITTHWT